MKTGILQISKLLFIAGAVLLASELRAQEKPKSTTIIITRGDTVINGKHIDKLSQEEKEELLKDFPGLKDGKIAIGGTGILLDGNMPDVVKRGMSRRFFPFEGDSAMVKFFDFDHDSAMVRFFGKGPGDFFSFSGDSLFFKRMKIDSLLSANGMRLHRARPGYIDRDRDAAVSGDDRYSARNSQSFTYSNTDKNGISTRMTFRVSDASKEDMEKTGPGGTAALPVDDLSFVPSFSTGNVTVSFSVATKGVTEVKLLDADFKPVFSEKLLNFSGSFSKQASLTKNGVYFLRISQGGKTTVKKVVKQG
jgi:hypothetical protein